MSEREFEHHQLLTKQLHTCLSKKSYLHICIDVHYYDRFFEFLSSPLHILKNSSLLSKEKEKRTTPSNHMLDFCVLILSIKTILFHIFFYEIVDSFFCVWEKTIPYKCFFHLRNLVRRTIIKKNIFLETSIKERRFS